MDRYQVLKKYFGLTQLKNEQQEIINEIMMGRDVLGILSTGYGKSLCYQMPALMMRGATIVVSPLISLMKDQVDSLWSRGIRATYINSSLPLEESNRRKRNIRKGRYQLIYVSPESLRNQRFTDLLRDIVISQVAVDEAHCISTWGHDFRPAYLLIYDFIKTLRKRPVITAFTATATKMVKEDIQKELYLQNPFVVEGNLDRENIYFKVIEPRDEVQEMLKQVERRKSLQGIIYCQRRKEAQAVEGFLKQQGFATGLYHGGIEDEARRKVQEDFAFDRIKVVVATNAFGMGIDKSNVRYVIHLGIPKNIESYYQEAGRAGRDQSYSEALLFYRRKDIYKQTGLLKSSELSQDRYAIEMKKLRDMDEYAQQGKCLRNYMLGYFGQGHNEDYNCGNCSNCIPKGFVNLTAMGKKVLSALESLGEESQQFILKDLLLGRKSREILKRDLQDSTKFGSMSNHKEYYVTKIIDILDNQGFLVLNQKLVKITSAGTLLLQGQGYFMVDEVEGKEEDDYREELYLRLKARRKEISAMENMAPYIIFHDENLKEMIKVLPETLEEFRMLRGVGDLKAKKYGKIFVNEIVEFLRRYPKTSKEMNINETDRSMANMEDDVMNLHQQGKTVEDMAKILGVVPGTIVDRLIREHQKGKKVDLDVLYKSHLKKEILEAVQIIGTEKLKPIKIHLEDQGVFVDYLDLKVVLYENYGIRKK
ncbi:MAG: RecQ family ATP-dependent DNA helicase [Clostridium sp.]|nr:RecQ family ATP-dependent DNA helicase [Clostridium sp.]